MTRIKFMPHNEKSSPTNLYGTHFGPTWNIDFGSRKDRWKDHLPNKGTTKFRTIISP